MLATTGGLPADAHHWSFELKWDGVRVLARAGPDAVALTGRSGADVTVTYPELAGLAGAAGDLEIVLDGEVVVLRADGSSDFQALAPRMHVQSAARARALAASQPVTYVVFDVLEVGGSPTIGLPYARRRELLESLELAGTRYQVSPAFPGAGADLLEASRRLGLEGVVAKRLDSPYRPGRRSTEWLKIKNFRTQEAVIGGFTAGEGQRRGTFGALLVGLPSGPLAGQGTFGALPSGSLAAPSAAGGLVYAGSVGTGFDDRALDELMAMLTERETATSPFVGAVDPRQARTARWVRPDLVGEVRFGHWTGDGRMRHPSWRGLRPDKSPSDVRREPDPPMIIGS